MMGIINTYLIFVDPPPFRGFPLLFSSNTEDFSVERYGKFYILASFRSSCFILPPFTENTKPRPCQRGQMTGGGGVPPSKEKEEEKKKKRRLEDYTASSAKEEQKACSELFFSPE